MRKMLMLFASLLIVSSVFAEDYNPGADFHVDAAWAGSAIICDEYKYLWQGIGKADSIVFNPHKWLGAQFDCSIHFLKDMNVQKKHNIHQTWKH